MNGISSALPLVEPPQTRVRADQMLPTSTLSHQGESLADVAQRAGTSEAALREANPTLTPFDVLPANTRVSTPAPAPADAASTPASDAGTAGMADSAARTPHGTLAEIDAIPVPDTRDLPPQLPPEDRQQILDARQAAYDARVLALAEAGLASGAPQLSDYASLPPPVAHAEYRMALQQYHSDIAALQGVVTERRQSQLQAAPGFQALSPEQQQGALDVLDDPAFQALPATTQTSVMAAMRAGEYFITDVAAVENHDFRSGESDAVRFDVTIDGATTPVYMPTEPDPALDYHPLFEVAQGLASLPAHARERVERIDVNAQQNPDDAHWEAEYNNPGFRSYMTAGAEGVVSIYPGEGGTRTQFSLNGGLAHEVGHIVMGQDFNLFDTVAWSVAMAADGQSVSDYANNSIKEDFAETYKLYVSVVGTSAEADVRAQYPERFEMLDRVTGND